MKQLKLKDGIIKPSLDSPFGFTPLCFWGWLWKTGNDIYISMIESLHPGRGMFRRLVMSILSHGYNVKVPTPSCRMEEILKGIHFEHTQEDDPDMGTVEVWVKHCNN